MGQEQRQRELAETTRRTRLDAMARCGEQVSRLLLELGPCHAVSIAFIMPSEKQVSETPPWGEAEMRAFHAWADPDVGVAYLKRLSEYMDDQHIRFAKLLEEKRKEQEDEGRSDAGGDVESTPGGDNGPS